jgi:Ca2+:H+ antiporter
MSNELHILLVFAPAGILSGVLGWNSTAVFILNMLAILPLAMLLSSATEELAAEAGRVVGALLNATFGNAFEMIVVAVFPFQKFLADRRFRSAQLLLREARLKLFNTTC